MATQPPAPAPPPTSLRPIGSSAAPATGCTGDSCSARDPWPLHHVKHRDVFCRLCTSCVLKYHPAQFCSLCLDLISNPNPNSDPNPNSSTIGCSSCNNVCHSSCLPPSSSASSADFFLCPTCSGANPDAPAQHDSSSSSSSSRRRTVDLVYAKTLLCAARIAAASMSRAAICARADAERKVKEAIVARKRAREMLESVMDVARREKERKLTRVYENNGQVRPNGNGFSNNNEGIGGLERKIAPLNSRVGKVEEQVEAKDIKPLAVLPASKGEGNQNP